MFRSKSITVVIRTIGRETLKYAIRSSMTEFENVIVVADDVDLDFNNLPKAPGVQYLKTGQRWDKYGSTALNMGVYAAKTPYITVQDDDDEFPVGVGQIMEEKVNSRPDVDIWIPTIKYSDGTIMCFTPGQIFVGNISHPTYKTEIFWENPFTSSTCKGDPDCIDYYHVEGLVNRGKKIDWYGTAFCLIRPKLGGTNGRGNL